MSTAREPWEANAAYFKSYPLPRPGWAWEFLRRHPDYARIYESRNRASRSRPRARDPAAPWGLMFLENPTIHARDALVFWRADAEPGILRAVARRPGPGEQSFDLWQETNPKAIAITQAGLVALIERDGRRFRLLFEDPDQVSDRMVFDLRLGSPPESLAEVETARAFLASFIKGREQRQAIDPIAPTLARYLQALDGHLAGAGYTEIGYAIHPGERFADNSDPNALMKGRGRHAVQRALFLMNGGYRNLLLPPPIALFKRSRV